MTGSIILVNIARIGQLPALHMKALISRLSRYASHDEQHSEQDAKLPVVRGTCFSLAINEDAPVMAILQPRPDVLRGNKIQENKEKRTSENYDISTEYRSLSGR